MKENMKTTIETQKKRILVVDDQPRNITKGEVKANGGQLGGYPFLAKPVVLAEVVACLKQQLGSQG